MIRQVTEIDRAIMQLRQQASDNLRLANELESKHCPERKRTQKKTSMRELLKSLNKRSAKV